MLIGMSLHAKPLLLSFDSPFPSTWFKKAIDSCMQVWHDMRLCQKRGQQVEPEDYHLLLESAVGRLVYAHFCLEHMIKSMGEIPSDDLAYLVQVVTRIQQLSNQEKKITNERLLCMQKVSKQLQLFLTRIMRAYN